MIDYIQAVIALCKFRDMKIKLNYLKFLENKQIKLSMYLLPSHLIMAKQII